MVTKQNFPHNCLDLVGLNRREVQRSERTAMKIYVCISHTAGCVVPDPTPAPENKVAICPGGEKNNFKMMITFVHVFKYRAPSRLQRPEQFLKLK